MNRLRWLPVLVAMLGVGWASGSARGDDAVASVSYYRDVRPILQVHCQGCHQPAKPGGGAILTDHAGLL
ncbi:MAG: hypothetical protein SGJ19_21270, partial [Planctomycetia bacterium]|nr:hypothetical protein [Planctomycetia bacterium]